VKVHTACRVELVRDLPGFQKLQSEWNVLLERSPNNSITLTWEWCPPGGRCTAPDGNCASWRYMTTHG
jgi:hypothetical protein